MTRDGVLAVFLDVPDHTLEAVVGEGLDLPAAVADDVVVVLLGVADGLEPGHAVAEVESLHEPFRGEHVEHAVDACQPHGLPARPELEMNFLRAHAAALTVEEVDHAHTRESPPVAGGS